MIEVARVLAAEGARWLAVSSVEEGVTLRAAGIDLGVLVMAGVLPVEREAVVEYGLTPAVHSLSELPELELRPRAWGSLHASISRSIPAWAVWEPAPPPNRSPRPCAGLPRAARRTHDPLRVRRRFRIAARPKRRSPISTPSPNASPRADCTRRICISPAPTPSPILGPAHGEPWCVPDMPFMAMSRPPAARRRCARCRSSRRSPGRPASSQ